ncbi:MAG: hypothetical protein ACRCW0_01885 [Clostridium sp.]
MKNVERNIELEYKKVIDKFRKYGIALIITYTLNAWYVIGLELMFQNLIFKYPILNNIFGIIYNTTNIIIPVLLIINFMLICDIIYIFISILDNKYKK